MTTGFRVVNVSDQTNAVRLANLVRQAATQYVDDITAHHIATQVTATAAADGFIIARKPA